MYFFLFHFMSLDQGFSNLISKVWILFLDKFKGQGQPGDNHIPFIKSVYSFQAKEMTLLLPTAVCLWTEAAATFDKKV